VGNFSGTQQRVLFAFLLRYLLPWTVNVPASTTTMHRSRVTESHDVD